MTQNANPQVAPEGHARVEARRRALYWLLWGKARWRPELKCWVHEVLSQEELAKRLRVDVRTIKRDFAELKRRGWLRSEQGRPNKIERGQYASKQGRYFLLHDPTKAQVAPGHQRDEESPMMTAQTTDEYARTGGTRSQANMLVAPEGQGADVSPLNHGKELEHLYHPPPVGGTRVTQAPPELASEPVLGPAEPEPWPTDAAGNPLPVRLHVPGAALLDHDPSPAEVLATLRAGLGEVTVLGAVRHDDPDAAAKLAAISAGPPRWPWQGEPTGRCPRCRLESHTTGPDGRPWHPFCWQNPAPPPRPAFTRHKRGEAS